MPVLTNGSTGRAQCREHMGSRWVRDNPVTWLIGQQWLIVLVDHGADMAVMSEGGGASGRWYKVSARAFLQVLHVAGLFSHSQVSLRTYSTRA